MSGESSRRTCGLLRVAWELSSGTYAVDGAAVAVEQDTHALLQQLLGLVEAHVGPPVRPHQGDGEVVAHARRHEVTGPMGTLQVGDTDHAVKRAAAALRRQNKQERWMGEMTERDVLWKRNEVG